MPTSKLEPIGRGIITWLGINTEGERFSQPSQMIQITLDGIRSDKYQGRTRFAGPHDGDYMTTDRINSGREILNMRQITIVSEAEILAASNQYGPVIKEGWLRENIIVDYVPEKNTPGFSKLPPLSRMVFGEDEPIVLVLTEENGPCSTITRPIAQALGHATRESADQLKEALKNRRGQMAMVRSCSDRFLSVGHSFRVFLPM
jgi:MOSC domain-containing protein YiiM